MILEITPLNPTKLSQCLRDRIDSFDPKMDYGCICFRNEEDTFEEHLYKVRGIARTRFPEGTSYEIKMDYDRTNYIMLYRDSSMNFSNVF